jgi:hypothetical protein
VWARSIFAVNAALRKSFSTKGLRSYPQVIHNAVFDLKIGVRFGRFIVISPYITMAYVPLTT